MKTYIVWFLDRQRRPCKRAVSASSRRNAIRTFLRRNRKHLLSITNIQEL